MEWQKTDRLPIQKNLIEPLLKAIKITAEQQKAELTIKLNNLKRLGVISMSKEELNKTLEEMKIGKQNG